MKKHFDPEEIRKFEVIAEEWWDPKGRFKPLHQINPLRLDYIAERIEMKNARILDVGCGGGLLSEGMAKLGAEVTGIDRAGKALDVARIHAEKNQATVDYQTCDAETWAETHAGSYDAVTCLEVLEHVPDVPGTVVACAPPFSSLAEPFSSLTLNRTAKGIYAGHYRCGIRDGLATKGYAPL